MPSLYDSLPEDRRNGFEQRAKAEAHVAAMMVAHELQPDSDAWYIPDFMKNLDSIAPPEKPDTSHLTLEEQITHDISQPGDFDVSAEAAAELEKQANVHEWLKRNMRTDDVNEAIYQFMLRKAYTEDSKQHIQAIYQEDPTALELGSKYYDQIAEITAEEQGSV